jgi:LTXXQ motif family protein
MQYLNVSTLVIASAMLAASFGPVRAEKDGDRGSVYGSVYDRVCSATTEHGHHHKMAQRLAEHLDLNDTQKAAYKEFVAARTKAVDDAKTSLCASKPDLSTFESRLTFHQNMLEARVAALKEENPKLLAFYKSLDADQKKKFDRFRGRQDRQ